MNLIFCTNCNDVFSVTTLSKRCSCKQSSAKLFSGQTIYKGNSAIPFTMPDEFFKFEKPNHKHYLDDQAIRDKTKIKSVIKYNEADHDFVSKVITYLNEKAGTGYLLKYPSEHGSLILSRRDENKVDIQEFYNVIDKKVKQWKGTEMEMYLRPLTLFGKKKFPNYLGEIYGAGKGKTKFQQFASTVRSAQETVSGGSTQIQNTKDRNTDS